MASRFLNRILRLEDKYLARPAIGLPFVCMTREQHQAYLHRDRTAKTRDLTFVEGEVMRRQPFAELSESEQAALLAWFARQLRRPATKLLIGIDIDEI